MHTRVQRGVQGGVHPDRLPSEDLPEELRVLIFQRFRGVTDPCWQYGHLTDVSGHFVKIPILSDVDVNEVLAIRSHN